MSKQYAENHAFNKKSVPLQMLYFAMHPAEEKSWGKKIGKIFQPLNYFS
jgi:hypothetical protein